MSVLGLIPCRGNSRRLPGKNLRLLHGRPLIGWVILEALRCVGLRGSVTVTTDADSIIEVALQHGAEIIKRPYWMATDKSLVYTAINHAVELRGLKETDSICLLQATSPLTLATDIDACIDEHALTGKPTMTAVRGSTEANGSVYCGTVGWLRGGGCWDDGSSVLVEMPQNRSVDINTAEDFAAAERMMAAT